MGFIKRVDNIAGIDDISGVVDRELADVRETILDRLIASPDEGMSVTVEFASVNEIRRILG